MQKMSKENAVEEKKTKKKKSALHYAIEFLVKIAVTALGGVLLLRFVIAIDVNHTNTSYPMIKDGDLCISFRLSKTLLKGDVIVYEKGKERKFGRIVATAKDTVDIRGEQIIVNGQGVYEDAVYPTTAEGAKIKFPVTVPKDSVFVLNDYRSDASDSRAYGCISSKEVRGKVFFLMRIRGF